MNIIGLGEAGCNIAENFKQYPQYKIFKIDVEAVGENCFNLPHQSHTEKYEENSPTEELREFLHDVEGEVLFITSCGDVSGASLRILEQLKNKKCAVSALYIKPDRTLLNQQKSLQENLMFGVLQEYARSALFERTYLVDNTKIAEIIGDIPIKEYFNQINELIVSTFHMIRVFDHSKPIMNTFASYIETARISTLGLIDLESGEEKSFFDFEMPREKRHYYAIPEKILESDGTLMKKIKNYVKNNREHDRMKVSYGIFATNYDQSYGYYISNSTLIENNEKNA